MEHLSAEQKEKWSELKKSVNARLEVVVAEWKNIEDVIISFNKKRDIPEWNREGGFPPRNTTSWSGNHMAATKQRSMWDIVTAYARK
jgi:hypothetical protein